jgi:hypothetical protein
LINISDPLCRHGAAYSQSLDPIGVRSDDTTQQRLDNFDWGSIGTELHGGLYDGADELLRHDPISQEEIYGGNAQDAQLETDFFHNAPELISESLDTGAPGYPLLSAFGSPSTSTQTATSMQFQDTNCRCREDLAALLPQIITVIERKLHNEIYQTTLTVMQSCEHIIRCVKCNLACTDLIGMMAVFQRTNVCFQQLAKTPLDSVLRLKLGGVDIPINDSRLRLMIILNLTSQANDVLDAISDKAQQMLKGLGCNPPTVAQTNMAHLDTVIRDFREVLRSIAESAT